MIPFLNVFLFIVISNCAELCQKLDQYCNCDAKCSLYGDCCPGHSDYNTIGGLDNILTCKESSPGQKIWVVDRCADQNHKLSGFCLKTKMVPGNRLRSLVPVVTIDGEIFENQFCARCNDKTKFQYLKIKIFCNEGMIPNDFKEANDWINNKSSCYVAPVFPSDRSRVCEKNLVRKCPIDYDINSNKTILNLCENKIVQYTDIIWNGVTIYRNEHCCACWNQSCFPFLGSDQTFSFSYLLNFNEWDGDDLTANQNKTIATGVENSIFYISYLLTILSMVSLIILIVIYASQRIFHTFGGYLTICLCMCLLLMNLLTLLLTNEKVSSSCFCRYIGIIQHYIALSNFIWMAIYALDLVQTFGLRTMNRSKKASFRTFLVYCAAGFGLAATIVASATITEFSATQNATIRPKYGGVHCWFTSKVGGIVWYFGPVCVLLSWNFVACVLVFYKLSKTAKECQVVQDKESNQTLWLCIRLTAVFGIGYILQILAVLSNVTVLINVGTLVNCLQGCLLVACFAWTKRVRMVVSNTVASISGSTNPAIHVTTTMTTTTKDDGTYTKVKK